MGFPVCSSYKELDSHHFILTNKKDEQTEKTTTPFGSLRERDKDKPWALAWRDRQMNTGSHNLPGLEI